MAAKIIPGSDGLVFLPHLASRNYPADSKVKDTWIGFSWSHKKAVEIVIAANKSIKIGKPIDL